MQNYSVGKELIVMKLTNLGSTGSNVTSRIQYMILLGAL